MGDHRQWIAAAVIILVIAPLFGWAGLAAGRQVARKYPGATAALWMLSVFLKLDPPPPPKAERVTKDEETPGAPPKA